MNATAWYAARAAGIVAYVLLSSGAVLGLVLSRPRPPRWPKFAVEEVHRFVTILTGVFIAIHVCAVLLDSYVPFSLAQVVVPFASSYRPLATALGVVALELLVAVSLTNLARRRIPHRWWRRAHYLTFGVWLAATAHAALAGTDRRDPWFAAVFVASVAAVAAATASRFARPRRSVAAAALAAAFALALVAVPQRAASSTVAATMPAFSGALTGAVEQHAAGGADVVSVVGRARGTRLVRFRVDLLVAGNQVERTALQLADDGGSRCAGTVAAVDRSGLRGTCDGHTVAATWTIDGAGDVSGRLNVTS